MPGLAGGSHLMSWSADAIYGTKHSAGPLKEERHGSKRAQEFRVI